MKELSLLFFFGLLFFGCEGNKSRSNKTASDSKTNMEDFLSVNKTQMQSKIDSAILVYDLAIGRMQKGESKEEITTRYELKIAKLSTSAAIIFEEVTKALERGDISQEEYNSFMDEIRLVEVKTKSKRLSDLGVQFDLKKSRN